MAVAGLSISLSYGWVIYCYIRELLWDILLPLYAVKQVWRFLYHWLTSFFLDLCRYYVWTRNCVRWQSWIVFVVSVTVWDSSSSTLHSTCGKMLVVLSLIVYLAHMISLARLSKTTSLAVISVVPELFSASWNIFIPLLSAKDWVSSDLLLNQESSMSLILL